MPRDVAVVAVVRLALGPGGHADGVGRPAAATGELPLRKQPEQNHRRIIGIVIAHGRHLRHR
jgi:hypothetical protein